MLSYLKGAAAAIALAALVACSQSGETPDATVTLQQIQNSIKATCNYVPTINSIAAVAATITTSIDPVAGATATVAVAVGGALVADICKAVQAQSSKMSGKKGETQTMDVTVNGVEVHGTYVPPENKT
jgi:HPt (histidine-containing phosphotransfer) domain-containing protein